MKAVVAAFNQEKALVGAFSVITNLRIELFEALQVTRVSPRPAHLRPEQVPGGEVGVPVLGGQQPALGALARPGPTCKQTSARLSRSVSLVSLKCQ